MHGNSICAGRLALVRETNHLPLDWAQQGHTVNFSDEAPLAQGVQFSG
jgi:hypothetical protein